MSHPKVSYNTPSRVMARIRICKSPMAYINAITRRGGVIIDI